MSNSSTFASPDIQRSATNNVNNINNVSTDEIKSVCLSNSSGISSKSYNEDISTYKDTTNEDSQVIKQFIYLLEEEEFEYGVENLVDIFLQEKMKLDNKKTKIMLQTVFLDQWKQSNVKGIVGILRAIARIDYKDIYPEGQCLALAGLAYKENIMIKECCIRAFESWNCPDGINILKGVEVSQKWLQDYINEVIKNLERSRQCQSL